MKDIRTSRLLEKSRGRCLATAAVSLFLCVSSLFPFGARSELGVDPLLLSCALQSAFAAGLEVRQGGLKMDEIRALNAARSGGAGLVPVD